jgi:type IV pilus assembly protein PilM
LIVDIGEKEQALQQGNREALAVSQALAAVLKDLVSEVHRSIDFYLSQGPERSIGRIALMGGSAGLKNLSAHLSTELKVPVSLINPLSFLKKGEVIPPEIASAFGVAVGLGLRRNNDWV